MISKLDLKVVRKGYDYLEVGRPKTTNVYEDLSNLNPYFEIQRLNNVYKQLNGFTNM